MAGALPATAHDLITTKLTWGKEISRIVYQRCASCHHPLGPAFNLLSYEAARPWAKAIQEQVSQRKMPPWNAVKGYGHFLPDLGLSQEEIATISAWVEGGAPEGDPNHLPAKPRIEPPESAKEVAGEVVSPGMKLMQGRKVGAIVLKGFAAGESAKLWAELPGGALAPLLWIHNFSPLAPRLYKLAEPVSLPSGTVLQVEGKSRGKFLLAGEN
ncbi:MAG: hypothetical protein NW208_01590 [Bryobacter sp.]|nr:hypothetical protein [Bryobacter sp.]